MTIVNTVAAVHSSAACIHDINDFSVHVSHPYSASVHTNADRSRCLTLMSKDLSFHSESRDRLLNGNVGRQKSRPKAYGMLSVSLLIIQKVQQR